jgi:hypothetical protein
MFTYFYYTTPNLQETYPTIDTRKSTLEAPHTCTSSASSHIPSVNAFRHFSFPDLELESLGLNLNDVTTLHFNLNALSSFISIHVPNLI